MQLVMTNFKLHVLHVTDCPVRQVQSNPGFVRRFQLAMAIR